MSDEFPAKGILLAVARQRIPGEITAISKRYHQYAESMMEFVSRHGGYVILKPSDFMLTAYPTMKDKLFVYTSEIWEHRDGTKIDNPILIVDASQKDDIPEMIINFTKR